MATNFTPGGPTVDEGLPPDPPAFGDDDGGGDHRDEHKLRLMLVLSHFIWTRVVAVANFAELPRGYAQKLLEELEDEGLVSLGYREIPRYMHFVERVVFRKRFVMGHQITAALTDAGRAQPKLVKLLEDLEQERREARKPTRLQQTLVYGTCGLFAVLVVSNAVAAF